MHGMFNVWYMLSYMAIELCKELYNTSIVLVVDTKIVELYDRALYQQLNRTCVCTNIDWNIAIRSLCAPSTDVIIHTGALGYIQQYIKPTDVRVMLRLQCCCCLYMPYIHLVRHRSALFSIMNLECVCCCCCCWYYRKFFLFCSHVGSWKGKNATQINHETHETTPNDAARGSERSAQAGQGSKISLSSTRKREAALRAYEPWTRIHHQYPMRPNNHQMMRRILKHHVEFRIPPPFLPHFRCSYSVQL